MNPLPPAVVARWSSVWGKDCCPSRPQWSARRVSGIVIDTWPPIEPFQWFRCDGRAGPTFSACAGEMIVNATDIAAIDAIDAAHPLPHPGFYPGQVWVLGDDEVTICRVKHRGDRVEAYVSPDYGAIDYGKDLLDGAILVAGPTPWGRDIPWSPT